MRGRRIPKIRIWVIVNIQLGALPEQLLPIWGAVIQRSHEASIRPSTLSSLKALSVSLEYHRLRDGVDIEFRLMVIPDDRRSPVKGPFKKQTMNALVEMGERLGTAPETWRYTAPNPESHECF